MYEFTFTQAYKHYPNNLDNTFVGDKLTYFGEAAAGNLLRGRDAQTWNTPSGTPPLRLISSCQIQYKLYF